MPAPFARGIIITVSVLLAAGLAVYENEQVRAWIDRTRHKIAMGLHSLGDDINPQKRLSQPVDASMMEEKSDEAEARRRHVREEILERGRIMEERRMRRKNSNGSAPQSPSFDTLVDHDGALRTDTAKDKADLTASTSAVEIVEHPGIIRSRHNIPIDSDHTQSVDAALPVRHIQQGLAAGGGPQDPFESYYEREMRNAWNIPLSDRATAMPSSHASESLIDLTPTTEGAPDPEISIPSAEYLNHPVERAEYFSAAASRASSHTLSDAEPEYYYAHPSRPLEPVQPQTQLHPPAIDYSVSSAPSVAGSTDIVNASEADVSEDDLMSDFGDGIRTPASAWTEVGSSVSGDD